MARGRTTRALPALEEGPQAEVTAFSDQVDLSEAVITGDFSGYELVEPVFRQCRFERVQLIGSTLHHARFIDCVVTASDFSGALMEECSLSRVELRNCRASGLQAPSGRFGDVGILSSRLDGANFRMSSWERAELLECDLADADFSGARMPMSRILHSDLSRAELSRADLSGSRLSGSKLDSVRGATGVRRVTISTDQIMPLALALFASQQIEVSDET